MVAIVLGLIGMVAGVIGSVTTGSPIGLLMWVPCLGLMVLGYGSQFSRFAQTRWGHPARPQHRTEPAASSPGGSLS